MYQNDMKWSDWASELNVIVGTANPNNVGDCIEDWKALYDKWAAVTYGLTDAQVAALPQFAGRTASDITAMRFAMGVFKALSDVYDAQKAYLVPFE